MKTKRVARVLVALGLSVALADGAISLFLIRDGAFLGRPLPPFGALTPIQRERLEGMAASSAPGDGADDLTTSKAPGAGVFDPELGWDWRPSGVSHDGLFVIDAMGGRKGRSEPGPRPAPGKRRVIAFGDSFTFGDEVPGDATFEWILAGLDHGLEVLNFGVGGYGTDQALLRYRRMGRDLGAEVACMGILLENIGRNVNRYRPLWNTTTGFCVTKPRFLLGDDGALQLLAQPFATHAELQHAILDGSVLERVAENERWLGPRVPTGRVSSLARLFFGYLAYRDRAVPRLWSDPEGEPFRVTLALLEAFHREALADGARLAPILVFPSKEDLRRYALPGRPYWTALFTELERRGVPCIDLITPLAERARELDEDPPAASLYHGGHLSRVGNAVVAHVLLDWIRTHDP